MMTSVSSPTEVSTPIRDLGSREAVAARVLSVVAALSGTTPRAIAGRAQLRSALSKQVGTVPAIWQYTVETGPERLLGDEPTRGERAVHTALTLWALHQRSHEEPMHRVNEYGRTIGAAVLRVALLGVGAGERPENHPIYRRFCAMMMAQTFDALVTHARGLIGICSSANVPLNYARFASDLYDWQDVARRSVIVRQWGRDFSRVIST